VDVAQRFEGLEQEVRDSFGEDIISLRREIHREPELGFDTRKTAEKVLAALDVDRLSVVVAAGGEHYEKRGCERRDKAEGGSHRFHGRAAGAPKQGRSALDLAKRLGFEGSARART